MRSPCPDSLGLPPRRIEPAERISCNTGQRLLSERVGEMNKRVQLEEELRTSRHSFCLCPAACPVPLGVGTPSATRDGCSSGAFPSACIRAWRN